MQSDELLMSMRQGREQTAAQIQAFVRGVVDNSVSREQAAAWLAWAFSRGLTNSETIALTKAMTHSGELLKWGEGAPLWDKHSTGGVGDKISLILAPLWVCLGRRVPMISGRGLGHTGGTLDKLEAIGGYRTDLSKEELTAQLSEVGCFISGQTSSLAPADKVLYALRNETCTVESIPLIVGSILSKKIAEGVRHLVLDVKAGSGAFMSDVNDARALAEALVRVGNGAGVHTCAKLTAMDRPLGNLIGNALEVMESVDVLKGGGPTDVVDLVVALSDHPDAEKVLRSGAAFEVFEKMVAAQGGDVSSLSDWSKLRGAGTSTAVVKATKDGFLSVDAMGVGRSAFVLGAGRRHAEDPVDMGVGVELKRKSGERVREGDELAVLYHRDGAFLEAATAHLQQALVLSDAEVDRLPLIIDVVG